MLAGSVCRVLKSTFKSVATMTGASPQPATTNNSAYLSTRHFIPDLIVPLSPPECKTAHIILEGVLLGEFIFIDPVIKDFPENFIF